jgi:crotonobetainyl-CoA:carnitine CoA-transferase CaiB-like acyl-CoA transferase
MPRTFNPLKGHANRGKRSTGLDLGWLKGREVLYELAKTSDVLLTNFLPEARRKLEIDVEHSVGDRGPER